MNSIILNLSEVYHVKRHKYVNSNHLQIYNVKRFNDPLQGCRYTVVPDQYANKLKLIQVMYLQIIYYLKENKI